MTPAAIAASIAAGLERLPDHLQPGLRRYRVGRVRPGAFLQAVLRNDLMDAVLRADDVGRGHLLELVLFLHHDAPAASHGSAQKVEAWLAGGEGGRP